MAYCYYLDLNINSVIPYYNQTGNWIDPIDTLQTLYSEWHTSLFPYEIGDINQDYLINILDIIELINLILNENSINDFYLSDINSDGLLNIQDLIGLVSIILNES